MKAEGFGVAEWNCLDGNTLHRNGFFGAAPPFSAPERHGRNRRCDGKVWTDWRTERERGKGTPPGRRGYTDAGTGHGAAAPGKEKGMPVVRMLQISPGLRQSLDGAPSRLCDKSTVGTWEAPPAGARRTERQWASLREAVCSGGNGDADTFYTSNERRFFRQRTMGNRNITTHYFRNLPETSLH